MRLARSDDEAAILALINRVQPHAPWTQAHYDWQFKHGPAGAPILRVIDCEGLIAGFLAVSRRHVWVDGKIYDGFLMQDGMTDPTFRGRGFFNMLATALRDGLVGTDLVGLMFPNKHSENSFRRTGWTELMKVPLRVAHAQGLTKDLSLLQPVPAFNSDVLAIWKDAGFSVGVLRSPEYLNWRYGIPGATYYRFMIDGDAGFAVLKVYDRGGSRVVNLCDFVVRKGERGRIAEFLDEVHAFAQQHGAAEVQALVDARNPYAAAFEAKGFALDLSQDRFIFTDGPADVLPRLSSASAWHISQADNDVY
ncbi:MAG: GNAT family N-acetyltransferase [Sandaracinaceae bacterium]|nr:GNAT family N-acetyltransferase [Sandaracinaceae bacterium]